MGRRDGRRAAVVCALLLLAVGLVFGRTVGHEFVNYDDGNYVSANPAVAGGLTAAGIRWAFTQRHADNWHPLTWLSHMLDVRLYGLNAWGHHLSSVLLHAAAAIALFLLLRSLTGRLWPSALAAALFAIHPLRVESVAWVAERKDVLSGLLFMLTLGAYVRYVRRPRSAVRYLAVFALFALGLMAKPMLVPLPLLLLVLDWWPLGRLAPADTARRPGQRAWRLGGLTLPPALLLEKVPLLALAAVSSALTLWAQQETRLPGAVLGFGLRLGNAVVAYADYLVLFFAPTGLAVFYPHAESALPRWKIAAAAATLLAATAAALALRRRLPHLLAGWLWYAGMLVPVAGLVQVGRQGMADRYTYLPQIGLGVALAWTAAAACRRRALGRWVRQASLAAIALLAGLAWRQAGFWRDSETLFTRALAVTSGNFVAHANLGVALHERGRIDEAIVHYRAALELQPGFAEIQYDLGNALAARQQPEEAAEHYRQALALRPDYAEAHYGLGNALAARQQVDEAIAHYRLALIAKPTLVEAHFNAGVLLANRGRLEEAVAHYRSALEIRPDYARARENLSRALAALGRVEEANTRWSTPPPSAPPRFP